MDDIAFLVVKFCIQISLLLCFNKELEIIKRVIHYNS